MSYKGLVLVMGALLTIASAGASEPGGSTNSAVDTIKGVPAEALVVANAVPGGAIVEVEQEIEDGAVVYDADSDAGDSDTSSDDSDSDSSDSDDSSDDSDSDSSDSDGSSDDSDSSDSDASSDDSDSDSSDSDDSSDDADSDSDDSSDDSDSGSSDDSDSDNGDGDG